MSFTRTFENYSPPQRYDGLPFTSAQIRESATEAGVYTTIQTINLIPVDADPAAPTSRNFTTALATIPDGWYIIRWVDASGATFDSDPVSAAGSANEIITLAELTAFLDGFTATDPAKLEAIELASDRIETACGVAFTPRTATETVTASNGKALLGNPMVITVDTVDAVVVGVGPYPSGVIPLAGTDHTVVYTYGYQIPPSPIKRAVKLLARHHLIQDPTDLDSRATFKSNEMASWSLVTPGVRGAQFPIPEVNQIVADYTFAGGVY